MRTTGQCVHSRTPPEFVLPDFVMLYLNKGGKYIMDTHRCCLAEVMRGTNEMERKMPNTLNPWALLPLSTRS